MKNKYLLICFLFFFFSCKENVEPVDGRRICCYTYDIEGTLNGQNWLRNNWQFGANATDSNRDMKDTSASYKCLEGLTDFIIGLSTEEKHERESFYIGRVSKKIKKYNVTTNRLEGCNFSKDTIQVAFYTLGADGDVVKDYYIKLDKNYANSFEVVSYEPIKNEFNCRFDLALIRLERIDLTYPDTIYLKGKFRIDGRLEWMK